MLRYIFSFLALTGFQLTSAQVEMANDFRGEGKIYVVIGVILIILAGLFYCLFRLDRRTKRLEKEISQKHKDTLL